MTASSDFVVVDVPGMLSVRVSISDGAGMERPDPDWHREAAESQFIFAEFLASKGLLVDGVLVARAPDLQIRWSQLTSIGQQFTRSAFHKWLASCDKTGTPEAKKREKLERRWHKFSVKPEERSEA